MFCTKCEKKLDDDALFCDNCGAKAENDRPMLLHEIVSAPIQEKSNNVCPSCGSEIEEDCIFCTECGKKLSQKEVIHLMPERVYGYDKENNPVEIHTQTSEVFKKTVDRIDEINEKQNNNVCPFCGAELEEDCNFCTECGTALKQIAYPNYAEPRGVLYASPNVMRKRKIKNAVTKIFKTNE